MRGDEAEERMGTGSLGDVERGIGGVKEGGKRSRKKGKRGQRRITGRRDVGVRLRYLWRQQELHVLKSIGKGKPREVGGRGGR